MQRLWLSGLNKPSHDDQFTPETLWTIGHSTKHTTQFLSLLKARDSPSHKNRYQPSHLPRRERLFRGAVRWLVTWICA